MAVTRTHEAEELRLRLLASPRQIPTRYLYDDRGSALFEEITRLPEYYPTRTEEAILTRHAREIVEAVAPRELAEIGSGAGRKIRILLDEMGVQGLRERCLLLDINERFLTESVQRLRDAYPDLAVRGVVADFEADIERLGPGGDRLVLFLASTIGNLPEDRALRFLSGVARLLEPKDGFLVGFDLVKDPSILEAAYDDAHGVTAAFNLNVLRVVNRRFDADFDEDAFAHVARYDPDHHWVEMRLRALRPQTVRVGAADLVLELEEGEELRTEISTKYRREDVDRLARESGLFVDRWFTDPDDLFASVLLRRAAPA